MNYPIMLPAVSALLALALLVLVARGKRTRYRLPIAALICVGSLVAAGLMWRSQRRLDALESEMQTQCSVLADVLRDTVSEFRLLVDDEAFDLSEALRQKSIFMGMRLERKHLVELCVQGSVDECLPIDIGLGSLDAIENAAQSIAARSPCTAASRRAPRETQR